MKSVTTPISIKSLDENDILHIEVKEGAHIDSESIRVDYELGEQLTKGRKVAALFDATAFFTITAEARDFASRKISGERRIATAVLADNIGVKILAHGYIKINKPASPIKIFNNREEAMQWLVSFLKEKI